jgi:hypothetical protein
MVCQQQQPQVCAVTCVHSIHAAADIASELAERAAELRKAVDTEEERVRTCALLAAW